MRYIGIDYGTKHIGLALSDESGTIAAPLDMLVNDRMLVERVARIVGKSGAKGIVIGESRSAGQDNVIMHDIRKFAEALKGKTDTPMYFESEQFSSVEATRYQPEGKKQKHDDAAAAIILQRFLDKKRGEKNVG